MILVLNSLKIKKDRLYIYKFSKLRIFSYKLKLIAESLDTFIYQEHQLIIFEINLRFFNSKELRVLRLRFL